MAHEDEHGQPLDETWLVSQVAAGRPVEAPIHEEGTCAYCDRLRQLIGEEGVTFTADLAPGGGE